MSLRNIIFVNNINTLLLSEIIFYIDETQAMNSIIKDKLITVFRIIKVNYFLDYFTFLNLFKVLNP